MQGALYTQLKFGQDSIVLSPVLVKVPCFLWVLLLLFVFGACGVRSKWLIPQVSCIRHYDQQLGASKTPILALRRMETYHPCFQKQGVFSVCFEQ